MPRRLFLVPFAFALLGLCQTPAPPAAAPVPPALYSNLQWRLIGPYRGGKSTSVAGAVGNPAVYYMGTAGSGLWKTSDGGRTWQNVTDSVRLAGIGAVAVAPSSADTVYVGSSGASQENGLYRSTDAGRSFQLVALQGHAVTSIAIDPKNADAVLASAGDTGVVRTTDGGATWTPVLSNGTVDLALDPDDPAIVYAATRRAGGGRGGAGRAAAPAAAPDAPEIYRSADHGATWAPTSADGIPPGNHGTIGLAVAPASRGQLVYAYLAQGLWMSSNGGAAWSRATDDPRLIGGGQFHDIYIDPLHPNVMFAMQTSCYRSLDAGHTWNSYTGAPSGDDFNALWIDPANDLDMILGVDQGGEISMNGGHSWTTWYNQPTGQLYNVSTDHQFPFFMYSSQQDSGTVAVPIRGNDGEITYRDWYTTNGFETARITPDPLHPNILYVTGWYGSILRVDHTTGQTSHVFERNSQYRESGSPPMEFAPKDPRTLYIGTQYLLRTQDEGQHWTKASPDLTVNPNAPPTPALTGRGGRGGGAAIAAIAPSPLAAGRIWVGTSNGVIQRTLDAGATWRNVTPPNLSGSIAMIEPGHARAATAYAVVGGRGPAASAPILRTDDDGKTWTPVVTGLPPGAVRAMREDPVNPNLLFAALDSGVWVSFNRGAAWQSLDLNLPNASCRDLAIEQNDLVLATYGRGLWVIDDIGSLRQMSSSIAATTLFKPTPAIRLQWDTYTDTPINPETATSPNPPDGAILDYYLPSAPTGPIQMSIYDTRGNLVRQYSSQGDTKLSYKINVPDYWLSPPALLPTQPGFNRFVWNLRYPDPPYLLYTYFGVHTDYFEYTLADHAIPGNTPWHEPQGPMVVPGQYEVRLTVDGQIYKVPLAVRLDPRLKTITQSDLEAQLAAAQNLVQGLKDSTAAYNQVAAVRKMPAAQPFDAQLNNLMEVAGGFGPINRDQARFLIGVTQADARPGQELLQTLDESCTQYNQALAKWNDLKTKNLASLHLEIPGPDPTPMACTPVAPAATTAKQHK